MKKYFCIAIVLLMLCAAIAFGVNAAEASPGKTVQVSVDLSENPGLNYLGLNISYDSSVMTLRSADNTGVLNGGFTSGRYLSADPYAVIWSSDGDMTGEGSILTLTFDVRDDAADGTYPVNVEVEGAYNQNMEEVNVSAYASSVSVKHAPETTTKPPETTTKPPATTTNPVTTTKPPATTTNPVTTTKPPETTDKPETTTKQPETTAKPGTTAGQTENGTKTGTSVTTTQPAVINDFSVTEPLASTYGEAENVSAPSGVNAESATDTDGTVNSSRTGKVIGISVAAVVIVAAAVGVFFVIKKKRLAV
ncbi:MAG: hypothetical protein K6G90_07170 [Clostridia bacterium]|nr:hypothetical protein [Clostridia bacterium]